MRLRRLELTRYGHFEAQVLDFGARTGDSDVTVVYGPNEAGKSTAFAAWLDLLYGFAARKHPYGFLFDRRDLLVGAQIEAAQTVLHLRRTAKPTGSLVDADGREVSEQRLAGLLHGLDRDAYKTRFSLNDDVLRKGGDDIAAAKGDLGRLLHAGTSGLSGLSRTLAEVQGEIDGFYRKGGSTQVLAIAKKRLRELAADLQQRRLSPSRYDELRLAVEEQERHLQETGGVLADARRGLAHAEAAERRRKLLTLRQDTEAQLAQFARGPDLPPGTLAKIVRLATEVQQARRQQDDADADRAAAAERLAQLVPDPAGLELGPILDSIDSLTFDDRPLLHRADGADADLARRHSDRDMMRKQAQALAERLSGQPTDPELIVLGTDTLDRFDAHLQDLRAAQTDLQGRQETLDEAAIGHPEAVAVPHGIDALADALDRIIADTPDPQALQQAEADAWQALCRIVEGLPDDWRTRTLAAGELASEDEVASVVAAFDRGRADLADATQRRDEARAASTVSAALLDALERNPATIDLARVQRQRAAREAAWSAHRAVLDAATADRFEAAMRTDDEATSCHAEGADARARLQARRDEHARATAAEVLADQAQDEAAHRARQAQEQLSALALRLLLAAGAASSSIAPRQRKLIAALDAAQVHDAARDAAHRGQQRHAALSAALKTALEASGGSAPDAAMVPAARRRLAALREAQTQRAAWQEREKQVVHLARRVEQAQTQLATRRAALAAVTQGTWAAGMAPDALRNALPAARQLAGQMAELRDLDHRIARMQEALETFDRATQRPREILGAHPTALQLMQSARSRFGTAQQTAREIAADTLGHTKAEQAGRRARQDRQEACRQIVDLLAGQTPRGTEEPQVFAQRLDQRDLLRQELARLDSQITEAGRDIDPALLDAEDALDDPARMPGLRDAVTAAEQANQQAGRQYGAAEQELRTALGAEGAAMADQERATVLEELRTGARDAAARLIGLAAARAGLRRLGESRRGTMLRETEAAFRTLTGGAWTRLDTWVDGQDEQLVGVTGGKPTSVEAMSTGTRAQLYLSLRIAGHSAFVREAGPLPFVTDDILESFDDARAAAALDLTAELGRIGQAILFTHHAHLVDMARARIAGVRVLELPPRKHLTA